MRSEKLCASHPEVSDTTSSHAPLPVQASRKPAQPGKPPYAEQSADDSAAQMRSEAADAGKLTVLTLSHVSRLPDVLEV